MTRQKCSALLAAAVVVGSLTSYLMVRAFARSHEPSRMGHIYGTAPRDDAAAAAAFQSMVTVLHHPRCMNCHSGGDFPRQGDDSHPHKMNVRRGAFGQGVAGMRCGTCHQDHNLTGRHMPPGAPDGHLPSSGMPMIWEGLSDAQLCELLKDPRQNGHRNIDEIVEHMNTPLVLWGWNPGEGRTPISVPTAEFLAKVKEWASKGAACPDGGAAR